MGEAHCPDCDGVITVDSPRIGEFIRCTDCGYELEIISTSPFEVDYPLDYDGDWDEEGEEGEDYDDEDDR
jgi:lysine biosynthesis protein LysW